MFSLLSPDSHEYRYTTIFNDGLRRTLVRWKIHTPSPPKYPTIHPNKSLPTHLEVFHPRRACTSFLLFIVCYMRVLALALALLMIILVDVVDGGYWRWCRWQLMMVVVVVVVFVQGNDYDAFMMMMMENDNGQWWFQWQCRWIQEAGSMFYRPTIVVRFYC